MLRGLGKLGWIGFITARAPLLRLARFNTMIGVTDKRWFIEPQPGGSGAGVAGLVMDCRLPLHRPALPGTGSPWALPPLPDARWWSAPALGFKGAAHRRKKCRLWTAGGAGHFADCVGAAAGAVWLFSCCTACLAVMAAAYATDAPEAVAHPKRPERDRDGKRWLRPPFAFQIKRGTMSSHQTKSKI